MHYIILALLHLWGVADFSNFIDKGPKMQLNNLPQVYYFIILTYLSYEEIQPLEAGEVGREQIEEVLLAFESYLTLYSNSNSGNNTNNSNESSHSNNSHSSSNSKNDSGRNLISHIPLDLLIGFNTCLSKAKQLKLFHRGP